MAAKWAIAVTAAVIACCWTSGAFRLSRGLVVRGHKLAQRLGPLDHLFMPEFEYDSQQLETSRELARQRHFLEGFEGSIGSQSPDSDLFTGF